MKRKIILLILTAGLSCSLMGCSEEYIKMDTETPSVSIDKTTGLPNLSQTLDVVDEDFKLVCDYDIGNNGEDKSLFKVGKTAKRLYFTDGEDAGVWMEEDE